MRARASEAGWKCGVFFCRAIALKSGITLRQQLDGSVVICVRQQKELRKTHTHPHIHTSRNLKILGKELNACVEKHKCLFCTETAHGFYDGSRMHMHMHERAELVQEVEPFCFQHSSRRSGY